MLSAVLACGIVACLLILTWLGFDTLSAARAFVGGEALWSKAQKEAVAELLRYAYGRDPADYQGFQASLEVPLGDRRARLELEQPRPDLTRVYAGFLQGRNHPDDVARMATFFLRFRHISFVESAIGYWTIGDSLIAELGQLGGRVHQRIAAGDDAAALGPELQHLRSLSGQLTRVEDSFSAAMGAGSRWAARVLLAIICLVAAVLLGLAGLVYWTMLRRLRLAEGSRLERESQYRKLVQRAPFGIARTGMDGRILAANPALVTMLGAESETALLQMGLVGDLRRVPPPDPGGADGTPRVREIRDIEMELRRTDGTPLLARLNGLVLTAAEGREEGLELFVEDITQRRVLETQLRQAQKMEALGQLTGGIAHDFNNLLTVILTTANLIEGDLPPERSDLRADFGDLKRAAQRGAEMIRKLLAFSRAGQLHFRPLPLGDPVAEATEMLIRVLPAHIRITTEILPETPTVRTDHAALEQILLNLGTNARDAMPDAGTLTITTGMDEIDAGFIARHGWGWPGRYGTVRVRDTGTGMEPGVRERLFEPFFTTKPPGQGTGLGMAMVYGLMKQHGGFVDVESAPGKGTLVTLFFPLAEAGREPAPALEPPLAQGEGTVLIVEDEATLRSATRRILERSGYEVLEAADGVEALELIRERGKNVGLILSDVVMPRMGGAALYRTLRAEGFDFPFLFTSGYAEREFPDRVPLPTGVPLLPKPWLPGELLGFIRERIAAR